MAPGASSELLIGTSVNDWRSASIRALGGSWSLIETPLDIKSCCDRGAGRPTGQPEQAECNAVELMRCIVATRMCTDRSTAVADNFTMPTRLRHRCVSLSGLMRMLRLPSNDEVRAVVSRASTSDVSADCHEVGYRLAVVAEQVVND